MPGGKFIGFQNHFIEQGFEGGRASSDRSYSRIPCLPETPTIPRFKFERRVGEEVFSAELQDWPKAVYQEASRKAGFRNLTWHNTMISPEGRGALSPEYWKDYAKHNIFLGFEATK
jgi:hypothetical protein